ncbi:hypothetical protein DPEC_G00179150 [Dallia pectoralis]|uniref:Uncharacterized protein n=1 Tax=Dallia pectoralis TaxID=75939 RepID=A0ACC2GF39_DALPE|nr:hypothetical protein DPEC_G00179150 [Dallia pectoralis]
MAPSRVFISTNTVLRLCGSLLQLNWHCTSDQRYRRRILQGEDSEAVPKEIVETQSAADSTLSTPTRSPPAGRIEQSTLRTVPTGLTAKVDFLNSPMANMTNTLQEARNAAFNAMETLSALGVYKYIQSLAEWDQLVADATVAFVEDRVKEPLDQFSEGLNTLGLLESIRAQPQAVTSRRRENMVMICWRDFLIEIDGPLAPLSCQNVLQFVTGADDIPPLGFDPQPTSEFLGENKIYPEANTCGLVLRLPLHTD